jgi:hypothetical protein
MLVNFSKPMVSVRKPLAGCVPVHWEMIYAILWRNEHLGQDIAVGGHGEDKHMGQGEMIVRRFEMAVEDSPYKLEAVCVECGADLIVVVGGGERYHCGALGLTINIPSIKEADKPTQSTYQIPVPGHKEEALARDGSLRLARRLGRNVVLSAGIHEDNLSKEGIQRYAETFYALIEVIADATQT